MNVNKIFIIFLIYFFSINSLFSIEPDVFVQSTVNRASKILSENVPKDKKIEELKLIAKDTVDIRGIGFYTLGSKRKSLNEEEKKSIKNYLMNIFSKVFLVDWQNIPTLKLKL